MNTRKIISAEKRISTDSNWNTGGKGIPTKFFPIYEKNKPSNAEWRALHLMQKRNDIEVVAILKDDVTKGITSKRKKMASNRIDVRYFYGDEDAAVSKSLSRINVHQAA